MKDEALKNRKPTEVELQEIETELYTTVVMFVILTIALTTLFVYLFIG